nr:tripeptide aminopeptidase [Candidatus Cloacimonadota bacterium]
MQNDVVSYFLQLVAINSESLNERDMIDALRADLADLDAKTYEDECHKETGGNAGNLYAYIPGNIPKDPILLCAHVDTVKPGNGIKAKIEGDSIVTDGNTVLGADDKSGVAEIMIAIKRIKDSGIDHAPIEILFTVSEEIGLLGSKCFDKSRLKSSFGYAFDTHVVGELVTGAPSQNSWQAVIHGRESHAGVAPEKGLNAIRLAAEAISAMPMGRIDQETTCNIGKIQGGEATNIVPNKVSLFGEVRSHDHVKLENVTNEIRKSLEVTIAEYADQGAKLDFFCNTEYKAFNIAEDANVVQLAKSALRNLNIPYTVGKSGGGSDANVICASGIPMIIVGTGMNKVHTVHESILIDELYRGADFVTELIRLYSEN